VRIPHDLHGIEDGKSEGSPPGIGTGTGTTSSGPPPGAWLAFPKVSARLSFGALAFCGQRAELARVGGSVQTQPSSDEASRPRLPPT